MDNVLAAQVESPALGRPARSHALMHFLMFLATVSWAGNIIAAKTALRDVRPLPLVQVRVIGAALLLLGIHFARRRRFAVPRTFEELRLMLPLALSGVAFNQLFFIGGLARTSVGHTGLIVCLGPVMVLVLACLMRLEPLTAAKFVGMLVSFAGVAVLTVSPMGHGNGGYWLGDLAVLAGSAVFAYYTIEVRKIADRYDALTLNAMTFALGALLMLPFGARAALAVRWPALPASVLWAVAYMVVFGSVVPYLIYAFALTELTASRVAAFSYLQPVIATSLGIWLLAEKLTWRVVVGGALILAGVYLTERERGEERQFDGVVAG